MPDVIDSVIKLSAYERDTQSRSFAGLLTFIPKNTTTWYDFFLQLFFESDGVISTTFICVFLFICYRLIGSPLDVSVEEKQCEREELWAAHNERFNPNNRKWKKPIGGLSWNGTGAGAQIREEAVISGKSSKMLGVMPASRDEALIAKYEAPDMLNYSDGVGGTSAGAPASRKLNLDEDGKMQEARKLEKYAAAGRENKVEQTFVTLSNKIRACVVGDKEKATVSIVTVHDIATTYRNGLLQMSVEMVGASAKNSNVNCVFYHLGLPGHDIGADDEIDCGWSMDELAGMVNTAISELNIEGRYVLFGEGAGANVVARAACEERQRDIDNYNKLNKTVKTGGLLTGLVCLQGDFEGPTVGQNLNASLGGFLMRRGWYASAAARFGVPECVTGDPGYVSDFNMMDPKSVSAYATSFYTSDTRGPLGVRRTRTLKNLPNLVMVAEECPVAKETAATVSKALDQNRGSGVVGISGVNFLGTSYTTGGGAILKDKVARANVIDATLLFLEAA
ncbi:hypothetical protein TrST_g10951 [Triparma strigata]|uniref:Uncharacterized protein n=1 Tax=Triparma strigata TaxID=1606541 RepID=A0A9W7BPR6_9STRA|nr:hypothetical protein TrST_g10951 [Triparma strigata]